MNIEAGLKSTLTELLKLCAELEIRPRLIGGLAVRGFARRKRFTHDIDLAIARHDKPNLIAALKQLGFVYEDQSQFEGVKAIKQVGETAIEIHIAVERLWDMTSNQTYTLSAEFAERPVDDEGALVAPTVSVEDLLILKLMPLRDRDLTDVIALLLDVPDIDTGKFRANCDRTQNTRHIAAQLTTLEQRLTSGEFREAWTDYYGEPLAMRDILAVLEQVRTLQKALR